MQRVLEWCIKNHAAVEQLIGKKFALLYPDASVYGGVGTVAEVLTSNDCGQRPRCVICRAEGPPYVPFSVNFRFEKMFPGSVGQVAMIRLCSPMGVHLFFADDSEVPNYVPPNVASSSIPDERFDIDL